MKTNEQGQRERESEEEPTSVIIHIMRLHILH